MTDPVLKSHERNIRDSIMEGILLLVMFPMTIAFTKGSKGMRKLLKLANARWFVGFVAFNFFLKWYTQKYLHTKEFDHSILNASVFLIVAVLLKRLSPKT